MFEQLILRDASPYVCIYTSSFISFDFYPPFPPSVFLFCCVSHSLCLHLSSAAYRVAFPAEPGEECIFLALRVLCGCLLFFLFLLLFMFMFMFMFVLVSYLLFIVSFLSLPGNDVLS